MTKYIDLIKKFILQICLAVILGVATILWTINSTIVAQDVRMDTLEKTHDKDVKVLQESIENLRRENREDHKIIMEMLRER